MLLILTMLIVTGFKFTYDTIIRKSVWKYLLGSCPVERNKELEKASM